jgi:hypothetical protein
MSLKGVLRKHDLENQLLIHHTIFPVVRPFAGVAVNRCPKDRKEQNGTPIPIYWSQSRQYPRMLHCQTRNQMRKSMYNPDPNPEIAPRMLLEAYERGYQANHGFVQMRDAAGEELHRKTICHAGYPEEPRAAFEEAQVEVPGFIHRVVIQTSGAGDIGSQITEEQLLADRRQVEEADIPPGLAITLNGPVPISRWVDAGIPPSQRWAMEAASWEEE